MTNWKTIESAPIPRKGDRVTTKFGSGYISDDYWAYRDRFTVQYDDGSESDHDAECIRITPPPSETE